MEHTIAQNKASCFGGRAPLFSQRDLLRLVGPLLVEQLLAVTVGMADTMMVSRCGEAAISGVSLVDMINNLIIVLFAALATGGAVVVSQYLGAKEQKHANASSGQLILLSALLGVGVGVFCFVLARPMIRLCYGSIDADVLEAGVLYLRITAVSYPFLAMYNAGAALFRSMGNSKISMQISILMNVINIVGNAVCIFVLGMGVDGVAWPSVVSRVVAAALILADKSDVRRNRVRNQDTSTFDIHDRVNYSVTKAELKINESRTLIKLKLSVDTRKAHSDKRIGIVAYQIKTHNFRSFQRSVKLYCFTLPFFCPEGVRPC